ncbi:sporulation protein YqfD [Clostridium botulinum]|uniref:sporulation protein YqfD n=1 Tax=Clostridium botulinum TaxID=1491 RepID=UPI00137561D8|nr:sporulation protein YqfD [Clostridium botulinum]MCC5416421.1 sporulation protein YqfD [Clostridium botulinum]NCI21017.1 sporulation protein YqfD [Clostridium botulinum]NCI36025.1 sporulation protein YqfD [Clostridium botulinum]NCI73306.1 sporulation protein YqfD [Clostridium botulinum]NDI39251.1 sporulation protein YqfD [Clostridium botulinum]
MKFDKYKNANITIEIQSMIPERFINLLWKNGVKVKNVVKTNVTTFVLDIDLKDYAVMENIARRTGTKVKIVKRKGISFLILFLKRRFSLVIGIFIFSFIIYFMSTFIWDIDITSTNGVTPYEIRQQLKKYGIKPGINKNTIDVYKIEEKLIKDIDNIMWVKARIEGGKLVVKAEERQSPPTIVKEDEPCNLVAKKDGEVQRVYTTSGSAIVQNGDIVKKGDILIKGEQGKEGETYEVHSEGKVFARTFYEEIKTINTYRIKRKRTGKKIDRIYINFKGKKLYLKKTINKFEKYDRIENNKLFITKETLYEVKETKENINLKKAIDEENEKIYKNITKNLDKSVKIVDKVTEYSPEGESCKIRMLIIAEEDIAVPQKIEITDKEEDS